MTTDTSFTAWLRLPPGRPAATSMDPPRRVIPGAGQDPGEGPIHTGIKRDARRVMAQFARGDRGVQRSPHALYYHHAGMSLWHHHDARAPAEHLTAVKSALAKIDGVHAVHQQPTAPPSAAGYHQVC